jgi:hypothetical protein
MQARLIVAQRQQAGAVVVVELRLPRHQRVTRQVPVGVIVLVSLFGLPPEESPWRDPETAGERKTLSLRRLSDKALRHFGRLTSDSYIATTRFAIRFLSPFPTPSIAQSSASSGSPFHDTA